jgi:superfamily II DNA helicase RecQ
MQCRLFDIRLGEQHLAADQARLNTFLREVDVVSTSTSLVNAHTQFWSVLVFYEDHRPMNGATKNDEQQEDMELNAAQQEVYDRLRHWRATQAGEEGVPPYVIAHNKALKQLACHPAQTEEDLLSIERFGARRVAKYGKSILQVLKDCQSN